MLIERAVSATSSKKTIMAAIMLAGHHRLAHRRDDWPEENERQQLSWVKAGDIGNSTSKDPSLRKRLIAMAKAGILEQRNESGGPRFRVKVT